jgi:hypothetical protein
MSPQLLLEGIQRSDAGQTRVIIDGHLRTRQTIISMFAGVTIRTANEIACFFVTRCARDGGNASESRRLDHRRWPHGGSRCETTC